MSKNSYPQSFFKYCQKLTVCRSQNHPEGDFSINGYELVPCTQGITEPIERILADCKLYITLGHILAKRKDPVGKNQKTHTVYSSSC